MCVSILQLPINSINRRNHTKILINQRIMSKFNNCNWDQWLQVWTSWKTLRTNKNILWKSFNLFSMKKNQIHEWQNEAILKRLKPMLSITCYGEERNPPDSQFFMMDILLLIQLILLKKVEWFSLNISFQNSVTYANPLHYVLLSNCSLIPSFYPTDKLHNWWTTVSGQSVMIVFCITCQMCKIHHF